MTDNTQPKLSILAAAWKRYAELASAAGEIERSQAHLRFWSILFSVIAVLIAVFMERFSANAAQPVQWVLKGLLALAPFLSVLLSAFLYRLSAQGESLAMRDAAGQIERLIYVYRTIAANSESREAWLEDRLSRVNMQLVGEIGRERILKSYSGLLPPFRDPKKADQDPGFKNLDGDEYFKYRLEAELAGAIQQVSKAEGSRLRLQWIIILLGCTGLLLAIIGGSVSLWAALAASLILAFFAGGSLSKLHDLIQRLNIRIHHLNELRDHWLELPPDARTAEEFRRLVLATEEVLFFQRFGDLGEMSTEKTHPQPAEPDLTLAQTIRKIALDYSDLDLTKETPKELLHQVIARFPTSGETKG